MTAELEQAMEKLLEGTEPASKPPQVEHEAPVATAPAAATAAVLQEQPAEINYPSGAHFAGEARGLALPEEVGEILRPSGEEMQAIMAEQGVVFDSGLVAATEESEDKSQPITTAGYADRYWTHFDFRADVRRLINRIQAEFPWLTYANTYYWHPPVFGRVWEFRSVDFWAGGVVNGRYLGYRGKNINITVDGWKIFNAAFNDPYPPNIAWIIFGGYMWSRTGGWTSAPWGPPGSDAGHYRHVHISYY